MKKLTLSLFICLLFTKLFSQTHQIFGKVIDINKLPIAYVNIFIEGSADGAITNKAGEFKFSTELSGEVTLVANFVGYKEYSIKKNIDSLKNIIIELRQSNSALDEIALNAVVVKAGNFLLQSVSTLAAANAVELATTAGSEGDLYKAMELLPGVQASGTDGRLLVRGGGTRETQTYIDGMHVLVPYSASYNNFRSRGKFSPFLFEGIKFSTGGYSSEYSQSLSAILPMDTKDESNITKLGIDIMNVSLGGGGTVAWEKGSASFNLNYTDLAFYNNIFFPGTKEYWNSPYRQFSGQNQFRFKLSENTYLKTFFAYDKTKFNTIVLEPFKNNQRNIIYDEDNLYLNTTFRKRYANGLNLFSGVAYSYNKRNIDNALIQNDHFNNSEQELHIKFKISKRFNNYFKMEVGAESMLRSFDLSYIDIEKDDASFKNNISGIYLSNDFNITRQLFFNLSGRLEHTSLNDKYVLLPRIALNYNLHRFNISTVFGVYQQNVENPKLMHVNNLPAEKNLQYLLSLHYSHEGVIYKAEFYHKEYRQLAFYYDELNIDSKGKGYSRGVELFLINTKFLKNCEYTISYSFNDTKRNYDYHKDKVIPYYVTKHNLAIAFKYINYKIRSTIGITNRFASGRPYYDPNVGTNTVSFTPYYNSLDISYTFLAHKKLIIYASFSNVLNRKNIYGYNFSEIKNQNDIYDSSPIKSAQNQSFYIGLFFTLGKNVAYDVSNF